MLSPVQPNMLSSWLNGTSIREKQMLHISNWRWTMHWPILTQMARCWHLILNSCLLHQSLQQMLCTIICLLEFTTVQVYTYTWQYYSRGLEEGMCLVKQYGHFSKVLDPLQWLVWRAKLDHKLWFHIVRNCCYSIDHKLLVHGHTYLPNDRDCGGVEAARRKHHNISVPADVGGTHIDS